MRLLTASSAGLVVSLAFGLAMAADKSSVPPEPLNVKVGLWQLTYSSDAGAASQAHAIRPELLARMTPEQRARAEARIRSRASQGPQIETRQFCLTPNRIKNGIFDPDTSKQQSCQRTTIAANAQFQEFHDECSNAGTKRSADERFESLDPDTFKGVLKVKAEGASNYTSNVEIAGKWIAADCGSESQ